MEIFAPEYYHRFRCIASACPDSCCKEWEVDVDETTAEFYRELPGDLGDRLRAVLCETDRGSVMTITDGRCPRWQQDGLCRIQAELGHNALCKVCREFQRLRHDYGDFAELGLEMYCPEAARMIFSDPVRSVKRWYEDGGEEAEYDKDVMATLRRSREEMLTFLERGGYSLPQTLAVMLLYGYAVQGEMDGGEAAVLEVDACLEEAKGYAQPGEICRIISFFQGLEILTPQWRDLLEQGAVNFGWTEALRPLLRYGIERYWLQAVSDFDLVCRVKFIIVACLLVNALGGDPIETSQLFSKEIENDSDNVEAILDGTYTHPAFTDVHLLGLILCET